MRRETKYRLNPKTLAYEKVHTSLGKRLMNASAFLVASTLMGTIIFFLANHFIDSPKEKLLKQENLQLKTQYDLIDKRLEQVSSVLENLQYRDDQIYRVIFEADPISNDIRKAGFGGVNRYKDLEGFKNSELIIENAKKLDRISKQAYIQSKSFDELYELALNKENMLAAIPAIQPLSNKDLRRMASGFGMRMHPIYKRPKMHTGIDFSAEQGTEIYATGKGTVQDIEYSGRGYGNHVVVNHGYGYQSLYGHMSKILVKPGQKVVRGQVIGLVGNTGTSVAPHLHYEVWKSGQKVNPINYFFNDLSPNEYEQILDAASQPTQSFD